MVAVSLAHMPRGLEPAIALAQVPSSMPVYVRAHALHAPAQVSLQQTPSRQKPLVQSTSPLHARPLGCLVVPASPPSLASLASRASFASPPPPPSATSPPPVSVRSAAPPS